MSLATDASRLAEDLNDLIKAVTVLRDRVRSSGDPIERGGFRLFDVLDSLQSGESGLLATLADLRRIEGRSDCVVAWGACPEHGNTLASSGGVTWCRRPECRRRWDYDRVVLPCTEPATHVVLDEDGKGGRMCDAHTFDARQRLVGAQITALQHLQEDRAPTAAPLPHDRLTSRDGIAVPVTRAKPHHRQA